MSLATITTSVVTGGSNSHATSSTEVNAFATDWVTQGCVGTLGNTSGVAPCTGSFGVSQDASPDMGVLVNSGTAYITATPSSQVSQGLRAYMASNTTSYTINSNSSGGTRYDWIYLQVNATNANNPSSAGDNVTALYTSRSTSNTADNGSPPTYGILLAIVTVANGASSITNANISDQRTQATLSAPSALTTATSENSFDHVASGLVWSGDSYGSTRNASMTAGAVYINGARVAVSAVTARTFTASKDTYMDVDTTGTVNYTEVSNNAASPALSANRIRIGVIITGATSIAAATSVNQGQETMVLPIASSVPYAVTDSLGNLICPRDAQRRILGYRQITSDFTTTSTSAVQVTGLSVPVIIPTARKVKVTVSTGGFFNGTAANGALLSAWDGVVASGTQIAASNGILNTNSASPGIAQALVTPSATSKTYNAGAKSISAGTTTVQASSTAPAYIMVELV